MVLKGDAPPSLLESYERERKPVVEHNAEWSLFAFNNHDILISSLGISNGAPPAHNVAQFAKLMADTRDGRARRARMREVFNLTRIEYGVHDLEMGFAYPDGAIVGDGEPLPERDPLGYDYRPSSHPGRRLPHAWLRLDGQAVSTHDLLPMGGLLVIAGRRGQSWCAAANRLAAETGLRIRAVTVGDGAEAADPSGIWGEVSEIGDDGALLVRPDAHVGFRAVSGVADPYATLRQALETVLAGGSRPS
jgi:2,4-dichlorophenol 6-monooxygenase